SGWGADAGGRAEAGSVVLEGKNLLAGFELAGLEALNREGDRAVDSLDGGADHGRADIGLIVVRADRVRRRIVGGIDVSGGAAAGDFEQNIRATGDLRDAELLAERRVLWIGIRDLEDRTRID